MFVIPAQLNTHDPLDQDFHLSALPVENLVTLLLQNLVCNSNESVGSVKKQNVRKDLLNELYSMYATAQDDQNRKNYFRYIRVHHPTALSKREEYNAHKEEYRTAKLPDKIKYQKLIKKSDYLWWGRFSHLKGEEGNECLRTMISEAKDMIHRKFDVIPYILGACGKLTVDNKL